MWLAVPFLLLVVVALPALAYLGSRRSAVPPSEWPPPSALYLQIIIVQSVVAGAAYLAAVGAGLNIPWGGQVRFDSVLLAVGVVLLMLGFSVWVRRAQGEKPSVGGSISPRTPADWLLLFPALLAAAFAEEYAYRGVLFALSARLIDVWVVNAAVVSLLFGLAHKSQGWVGVWGSAAFGFGMQALVAQTGGLALAVVAHLAYDAGIEFLARRRTRPSS